MSAPEAEEEPRRTVPLKWLTWGGLGLAPLAALLLLLGDGDGSLRLAMVIAIASVVLIGLSITLRGGVETMRADMEDALVEEMDVLREDVRNDISTAVRATHRAFGEKMQVVQDDVEALRGQLDVVRAEIARSEPAREQLGGDRAGYDRFDQAAPASAVPAAVPASGPTGAAGYGGQYNGGQYGSSGQYGSGGQAGRASVPAVSGTVLPRQQGPNGVVRQPETVQVSTRQVVDPRADDEPAGTVYGGTRYGGRGGESIDGEWSAPAARGRRSAEPDEESWTERRLRDQPEERWSWSGDRDDSAEQRYGDRPVDRWDVGRADGFSTGSPAERWPPARDDDYPPARDDYPPARSGAGARNGRYPQDRGDLPGPGGDRVADEPPWRDARWDQRMADPPPDGPGISGTGRRAALPALPAGSGAESPPAWSSPARDPLDDEPVRRSRRYRDEEDDVGRRFRDDDPPRRYRDDDPPRRYRDEEPADPGRRYRDDASGRRYRDDEPPRRYAEEGTAGRRYRDYDDEPGRRYRDYDDGAPGRRYRDPDDGGRRYRDDDGRGRYRDDVDFPDDRRWR
ncbi:hypothetical protein [Solwaraspora sp. WMMD792]|uniref:hypothetical protein n=1 Tax=Solwaraspora sp. WMMD792 TaxID=3016099 RepID=UPI002415FC7B|nr:hypothetical protein [Solwaraspora sp. WMMD792]MDG4773444.1 hypothetical protein [Solwaraspora sp. WMMD792]